MKIKIITLIIVTVLSSVAFLVLGYWVENNSSNKQGSQIIEARPLFIPEDWYFYKDNVGGYSLYYSPEWELDLSLEEHRSLKNLITKDREPSEGFYIINAIFDSSESILSVLEQRYAEPFRKEAIDGTLQEEHVGIQGRDALALESEILHSKTKEKVKANLLLLAGKDGKPGYAISAVLRGPKAFTFLEHAKLMTQSFKIY